MTRNAIAVVLLPGIMVVAALASALAAAPPRRLLDTGHAALPPASDRLYRVPVVEPGSPSIACRDPRQTGLAVESTCAPR